MENLLNNEFIIKILESVLAILIAVILYLLVKMFIDHRTKKMGRGKRITYWRLARSILKYLAILAAVMAVLQINGVNTVSILAGLGLVSVIAGLALQDALKDIIMGFNIIADNYFAVGDIVKVNGITGKVVEIGIKATKIRNLYNQNLEVIANRNISAATVLSQQVDIDVPLSYEEKLEETEAVLAKILDCVKEELKIKTAEYKGVQSFGDSAMIYKLRFQVVPELSLQTSRDIHRIIKRELDAAKIEIPYQQIDVHTK